MGTPLPWWLREEGQPRLARRPPRARPARRRTPPDPGPARPPRPGKLTQATNDGGRTGRRRSPSGRQSQRSFSCPNAPERALRPPDRRANQASPYAGCSRPSNSMANARPIPCPTVLPPSTSSGHDLRTCCSSGAGVWSDGANSLADGPEARALASSRWSTLPLGRRRPIALPPSCCRYAPASRSPTAPVREAYACVSVVAVLLAAYPQPPRARPRPFVRRHE
jgi:hypothetical protein